MSTQPHAAASPSSKDPGAVESYPSPISNAHERRGPSTSSHSLSARSCVTCRRRKVKCDKQNPCSNCTKAGSQCVFPAPGRAPRRPRQGTKVVSEREAELLKRLRRLEGVVEELSGQVEIEAVKHSPSSDNSSIQREGESSDIPNGKSSGIRVVGMDEGSGTKGSWMLRAFKIGGGPPKTAFGMEEAQNAVGRLILDEGKSEYFASPFWASISDEVEEIRSCLEDQDYDSDSDAPVAPSNIVTEANHQSFVMGYSSSEVNMKVLHPLPSQIPFYWQTFLENVQPLVKIIHTPTMTKVIKEVQNNLDSLSKSTEALMFSIYFATVTSMTAAEVRLNFGVEKDTLLKQYRFGVEQALARANFLNTNEIVTVQAFVLFLVCVRRYDDTRFVWSLTGLALRIAQSLGLHRDGSKFGLSPFDCEMRRRLWWHVMILDIRASEDYGSEPSIADYSYDTEFPLSINDDDLDPQALEPPAPRPGVSEMTFCLIRFEICNLTRKLSYVMPGKTPCQIAGKVLTLEDKERMLREFSQHLETTYLQYCEDAGPLCWVGATVARLILAKMSLILYHPFTQPGRPNSLSQDIKDRLFMAAIEIIEYTRMLASEASTKKWGWLFQTYIQWHAIAYILGELCVRSNSVIVERAWIAVDSVFGQMGLVASHGKSGMLWQPLRKLMAKARRKKEENIQSGNTNNGLGIPNKYFRPVPEAYGKPSPCPGNIATDRLWSNPNTSTEASINNSMNPSPFSTSKSLDMAMEPQILPVDHPDIEQQLQQQPLVQPQWAMDDNAVLDLNMNLDGDVNWEGWDDLVREFQVETDGLGLGSNGMSGVEARGPSMGGIGQWW